MKTIHTSLHRLHNPDAGILLVRLALAAVFIFHGWQKVVGISGTAGFFAQAGIDWIPGATFWAYVVAYTEFLGGIALLLGIFVRYAGILLAITMAVAAFVVHGANGFNIQNRGYEYAFTLLMASAALVCFGAGNYSLAKRLKKHPKDVSALRRSS